MSRLALCSILSILLMSHWGQVKAGIIVTFGAGTAVTTVDRQASFDNVISSTSGNNYTDGTNLLNYTENQLLISVNQHAYTAFDPTDGLGGFSGGFHYPTGGADGGTMIKTTDNVAIFGIEFNVGTGWVNTTTHFAYEAFKNGINVGAGAFDVTSGSVLGFSDSAGFDTLYIGAYNTLATAQAANVLTANQAVAIDNVKVQLEQQQPSAVPEPASLLAMGLGATAMLGGLRLRRQKNAAQVNAIAA